MSMPNNPINAITVDNVFKYYKQKKTVTKDGKKLRNQDVKSVDGVSFHLEKGEVLGVIGESGCGKSTLGRLLVKLEDPTLGSIRLNGELTDDLYKKNSLAFRRTAQMIFQNPFDTFDPRFTIEKILLGTLKLHKIGNDYEERLNMCMDALERGGLRPASDFLFRYPHELSGGQLQRISIIRSMLLNPLFVVADEPVSMLDVSIRADIINMLGDLCKVHNTSMVFISHDITTTRYISDRVAVMYLGRFVETGPTDEVMHNPKHPYTRALISNSVQLDSLDNHEIIRIEGEPPTPINTGPGCHFAPRCYQSRDSCKQIDPELVNIGNGHFVSCPHAI